MTMGVILVSFDFQNERGGEEGTGVCPGDVLSYNPVTWLFADRNLCFEQN